MTAVLDEARLLSFFPATRRSASRGARRPAESDVPPFPDARRPILYAQHSAEVAEAAAAEGMFWEMHDTLFANQDAPDDASWLKYAADLSIDAERIRRELASHAHAGHIADDHADALASGVRGTPTFYIMVPGTTAPSHWARCSPQYARNTRMLKSSMRRPPRRVSPASRGRVGATRDSEEPRSTTTMDRVPTPSSGR